MRPSSLTRSRTIALLTTTALTPLLGALPAAAQNLPTGASVAYGSVGFQRSSSTLTINQGSQNAIVNYNSFSIGQRNTVNINQPNVSSVLVNRVVGSTPSTIAGQLNANGQVYLINPNGIAITKTGVVKVGGGFVASTLGASDADLLKRGKKHFKGTGASAAVTNAGTITIGRGGYAALIGGEVRNTGTIAVPMGKVGLGSGEVATLDVAGDGFLQVAVPTASGGKGALIQDSGTIKAVGGTVILDAATARAAARNAVNISGTIDAHSISGHNGAIVIGGGEGGTVKVSGSLDVASRKGTGGSVTVTGNKIKLKGATINASGATGGGSVKIGGALHGGGTLQQASRVAIDANTVIKADATQSGNGGTVVVWSTGTTTASGLITATGGPQGGNGGTVETSGARLDVAGLTVDASAAKGAPGSWLLDPTDLVIDASLASAIVTALDTGASGTNVTLATSASGNPSTPGFTLTAAETNASGNGDIDVNSAIAWSSQATLTLNAYNAIVVNAPISFSAGGLTLVANGSTNGGGIAINANVTNSGTGAVSLTAPLTSVSILGGTASISLLNLSFAQGASLSFTGTNGTTGAPLGSLTINGTPYTLLNALANNGSTGPDTGKTDVAGIDSNSTAGGDGGHYALATNLDGTTTTFGAPLVGSGGNTFSGTLEGLGHTISNLTISDGGDTNVGFIGQNSGTVRDISLVGGSVSGTNNTGFLVGLNTGIVAETYETGAINGGGSYAGGLVGSNGYNDFYGIYSGTIIQSYATGAVSNAFTAGGLVGHNDFNGTITQSYATGAVGGSETMYAGGLVGDNIGQSSNAITQVYATGAVSGSSPGGLVGDNLGFIQNAYWDTLTTGQNNGIGPYGQQPGNPFTGYTTAQLQGTAPISGNTYFSTTTALGPAFGGGSNGVYPYLKSFFPNGVQTVSGLAYQDTGATLLTGNTVSVIANNQSFGIVTTGANGYYYAFGPAGSLASGNTVLATTSANTGATNAATLAIATGATNQQNVTIFGNTVTVPTTTTSLAAYLAANGGTLTAAQTAAQTAAEAADDANHDALASIQGAGGLGLAASGSSFKVDAPVTTAGTPFVVQTTASGAPITVTAPITINDSANASGGLGLLAAGALLIDANVTVTGAGVAALAYDRTTATPSVTDLAFAQGSSLSFTAVDQYNFPLGTLVINGAPYTLLTTLTYLGYSNSYVNVADIGGGVLPENGNYALAFNLDGTGLTFSGPLVGPSGHAFTGTLEGLGHTITNLTINDGSNDANVGFIGQNSGTVRDIGLVGGSVSGSAYDYNLNAVGFLVGLNTGTIANTYATGAVNGGAAYAGGLLGENGSDNGQYAYPGTIVASYATGAVSNAYIGGGLVGHNDYLGTITQSYATGAVNAGGGAGGLVGQNDGTITQAYATGAVSPSNAGAGAIGADSNPSLVSQVYWDTLTSGIGNGVGLNGQPTGTGLTTAQLQSGGASGLGSAFAGGTGGLYPYLTNFFPNGMQAVSGTAYSDAGATPAASNGAGAVSVGLVANGASFGTATTGANGYFYVFAPAATAANGTSNLLAYSIATNSATLTSVAGTAVAGAGGSTLQTGVALYGNAVTVPTSATSLSSLGGFAAAQSAARTAALAADGGNASATAAITGATGLGLIASGAGFTIDAPVSTASTFVVQTTASSAPVSVADPITIGNGGSLGLSAAGALKIAAPIAANGAVSVALAYDQSTTTPAVTDLSFGLTTAGTFAGSLTYNDANGNALTASPGTQSLSVNGTPYTLLYNMMDVASINNALGGNYALATNIDASTAGTYTGAVVGGFSGTFEGLGDTISNLTINAPVTSNVGATDVGLFRANSGTLRDFALAGGSVIAAAGGNFTINQDNLDDFAIAGGAQYASQTTRTGSVVANNAGTIVGVATSAAVSGVIAVGGLAGVNSGMILNSMASGAVTGVGDSGYGFSFSAYETGGLVGLNYMGTVSGSWATGAVSGYTMVGGLIGAHDDATMTGSYATGAVTGYMNVGGLIGNLEGGTLQSSYATGAVTGLGYQYIYQSGGSYVQTVASTNVGGLIGEVYDQYYTRMAYPNTEQSTSISSSYATGNVTAANGYYVGGLIGYSNNYGYTTSPTTLTGVYATGAVSGSQNVGGLAGRLGFATLNGANATGAVSGNQAVGGLIGQLASVALYNASASGAVTGVGSGVVGVGGLIGVFSSLYPGHSEAANISASGAVTAPDGANYVGGLIGVIATDLTYSYSPLIISNASATGSVTVGVNASNVGGLVGADGFPGYTYIGGAFFGYDPSLAGGAGGIAIDSSFASGAVKAGNNATAVGGLIGSANNAGSVFDIGNSYATGSVTVGNNAARIGGLIGDDQLAGFYGGDITGYGASPIHSDTATGAVTAGANATLVGGLIGSVLTPELDAVSATGAVTVGPNSNGVGGLAGGLDPNFNFSYGCCIYYFGYSTGRVSAGAGSQNVDASIGANYASEFYSGSNYNGSEGIYLYYNSDTAGVASAVSNPATTAQFMDGTVVNALNSQGYNGYGFSGGTGGLYPFQPQIFPTSVQAITGYAYNANGATAAGAGVSLAGLGSLGQTTTGANGAYYIALPAGTLGTTGLATAGSLNAATLTPVAGTGTQAGVNLYANTLSTVTSATLLSAAPTRATTIAAATNAAGTDTAALATLASATGYGVIGTGASFTLDQMVTSSGSFVAATTAAGAPLSVAAPISASGTILLQSSGALTIASGGSVAGASPVLATTGAFVNNAGSTAVTATSGAWQIFSAAPVGDTFGGLNSGDTAIWNAPAGTAVSAAGDRYVFATAPMLTVATVNDSKTYGVDATSVVAADYTITGFQAGVAGAYLGDTAATAVSGTASVTSTGAGAGAVVGSYADQLAIGTLASSAGYGFTLQNAGTLTVNPAALTIIANNASKTYGATASLGTTAFTQTGLVTANGDAISGVTLASPGTAATATVAGGPYAITASNAQGTGLSNYAISYVAGALTVNPAALTITALDQAKTYGQTASLGTTAFSATGLVNADTISGVLLASSGAAATANVAGSAYAITASSATGNGLSNYAIGYVGGALTVNPLAVSLSGAQVYNGTTTVAGSTLSIANLVGSDSVSIAGSGTMAGKDVGSQALVSLSGLTLNNTNYTLVGGSGSVSVTPATLTYAANATSRTYGAANPALSGTVTGFVGSDTQAAATSGTLSFSTTATSASNVGGYAITGSGLTALYGDYMFVQAPGNATALTVTPAALTITAANQVKTYGTSASLGTTAFTETGLVNGDGIAGVTLASTGAATGATVNGGTPYAIVASNAQGTGLSNYAIGYVNGALTVSPAALTITAANQTKTYGQTASLGTTAFTETGLVNGDGIAGVTLASTGAATGATVNGGTPYAIIASNAQGTGLSNYAIGYVNGALTVSPAALTITAANQTKTYGASASLGTTASTETGLVNGDSISGVTLASTGAATGATVNGGTPYAIVASNAQGTGLSNYAIGYVNGALTVNPAALTITASNQTKTYGQTASLGTTAFTETGLVNGDGIAGVTLASTGSAASANVAGAPYAINASNATGTGLSNYAVSYVGGALTVNPLAVSLSGAQVYNGTTTVAGSTLSIANLVGSDSVSIAGSGTMAGKDVGSQALVSLSGLTLNNTNYTLVGGSGSVSVTPATLTYAANATSRTYGAANPALSGTVTGFVGSDTQAAATSGTLGFTTTAATASGVGSYAITGSGLTAAHGDYTFVQASTNSSALAVNPAALTITANNASKTYGQPAALGTTAFTETGLVNGDTISGVTLASAGAAAVASVGNAPYAINASNASGTGLGNYAISYVNGALTVNPAALTITANNASKTYGTMASLGATAFTETGLVAANGDAISGVTLASAGTAAGATVNGGAPYAITASNASGTGLGNYAISYVNGGLTVNPAALTIEASNQSKTYGQVASLGTTVFTETGLVSANGDVINGVNLASTGAAAGAAVNGGTPYAITASAATGSGLSNYAIVYVNGALTVNPAALTITASNQSKTYGQVANLGTTGFTETGLVAANGDAISGVTLASTGSATSANVAGSPYAINASNASGTGLGNYAISYVDGGLTVNPAALTITANNASKTYGTVASLGTTAFSETGLVGANGDTLIGVTLASTGAASTANVAGTPYAITASNAAGSGLANYAISYVNGALTVNPAALTIAANNASKTYGQTASLGTTAFTETGLVSANGDTLTGVTLASTGAPSTANVASSPYAITASAAIGTGLSNYAVSYVGGALTVNPAALTITANNASKTYGTVASLGTTAFTETGLVAANGDTISGVTLASTGSLALAGVASSPYAIVASNAQGAGLSNYTVGYVNGALTVNPAALTITANNASKTYGQVAGLGTTAFTETGLVTANGDTISGVTLASIGAPATANVTGSPYAIAASAATGTGLSNYAVTYMNGALTVNPAALTITANNASKTYGTVASLGTTAFTDTGLVAANGDTLTGVTLASTGAAAPATVAGSPYAITASNAQGNGLSNYAISYVAGTLTVTPAPVVSATSTMMSPDGLGSTIVDASLETFGRPGEPLPFIASTLQGLRSSEGSALASQIVQDLSNPRIDEIIVCFKGACTIVPVPARTPQKTSQLETNVR